MFIGYFVFLLFLLGNALIFVDGTTHCCPKPLINITITCANGNVSTSLSCQENKSKIDYYAPQEYEDPITSICNLTNHWVCHNDISNKETFHAVMKCVDSKVHCERITTNASVMEYVEDRTTSGYLTFSVILNLLSVFFLLCTSFLYFLLPQMNYTHGTSVRNYTFILSVSHLYFATYTVFPPSSIASIIYNYLFMYSVVSAFNWLNLISYSTWRSSKGYSSQFDRKTTCKYYTIGYGCPIAIVSFSFTVSWLRSFLDPSHIAHNRASLVTNAVFMIPVILLINLYFFFDSLKWLSSRSNRDCIAIPKNIKSIRYRVWLDFKLFLIALLWIFFEINLFFPLLLNFGKCVTILLSTEGMLIFIVVVLWRKTVLQSLADRKYNGRFIFPSGWKSLRGPEYEESNQESVQYINNDVK